MKKILLSTMFLACSPIIFASELTAPSTINMITVGEAYVRINMAEMAQAQGCAKSNFYRLEMENGEGKTQFSTILSAKATQSEIYFLINGCVGEYAKITHTYLK